MDGNIEPNTLTLTNHHPNLHGDPHQYRESDTDFHEHTHSNCHRNLQSHAYGNSEPHRIKDTDRLPNPYTHGHALTHSDFDEYSILN